MNTLENQTVKLRSLEPADIDLLFDLENDTDIWEVSNTIAPFSKYILKQYIENSHLDIYTTKQLRLVIESKTENKPVGLIDLFDFNPTHLRAGIGILIIKKYRQKSYASNALKVLIQYTFSTLLLNQIYCNISANNEVSITLFKKHGFKITGCKENWLNVKGEFNDELFLQLHNK
ncbi:MAG: GNAT family N-acetyltransferase [bacterium]|nr:GNAT family N-acetyltransferase [bacterium]